MVVGTDFPNLLICGGAGSGKTVLLEWLLQRTYGALKDKCHVYVDVSKADSVDVEEEIMPHLTRYHIVTQYHLKIPFMVVIDNAHLLSFEVQAPLRRHMEKFQCHCRFVLIAQSETALISPLRSRCFMVKTQPTKAATTAALLSSIDHHRSGDERMKARVENAVRWCEGNVRVAFYALETDTLPPWLNAILQIAKTIVDKPTVQTLVKIRQPVYVLFTSCMSGKVIIKTFMEALTKMVPSSMCPAIVSSAAKYELRIVESGSGKDFFHIEGFFAEVICAFRRAPR